MNKSSIEWCDYTWNPVTGCSHVSEGCRNCYAEGVANRFWGDRKFTDVECHEDRLAQPLKVKKGARVFVNSMSDLFHEKVPFEFIDKVLAVAALCPQHIFMVLTKRPERMLEYMLRLDEMLNFELGAFLDSPIAEATRAVSRSACHPLPCNAPLEWFKYPLPNLWLGASCHDQPSFEFVWKHLSQVPAAIRWVSYEPALGPVDFTEIPNGKTLETVLNPECWGDCDCDGMYGYDPGCRKNGGDGRLTRRIDWVIAGGESGPHARPSHPDWFRQVRDQCVEAGVPFFFKQWGEWGPVEQEKERFEKYKYQLVGKPVVIDILDKNYEEFVFRAGKKKAGRLLDGIEWNQYPEVG